MNERVEELRNQRLGQIMVDYGCCIDAAEQIMLDGVMERHGVEDKDVAETILLSELKDELENVGINDTRKIDTKKWIDNYPKVIQIMPVTIPTIALYQSLGEHRNEEGQANVNYLALLDNGDVVPLINCGGLYEVCDDGLVGIYEDAVKVSTCPESS